MMNLTELNKLNIDNLTQLWKKLGTESSTLFAQPTLHASASWPHRHWFDWSIDVNTLSTLDETLKQLPARAIVPVWDARDAYENHLEKNLTENNFVVSFIQTAMYLPLENYRSDDYAAADIAKIHTHQDIETWVAIASEAFGYSVDPAVIHRIAVDRDVQLLLLHSEGEAAATALLYKTDNIIGVHLVGVANKFRGKGIAYLLMQHVIDVSKAWGGDYITLQASAAGEGIYKRLGFVEQFIIRNYHRILV